MPVQPSAIRSEEDRAFGPFADGQVDRPGGTRCEWNSAWPLLRRVEADLVAQVRQRLGPARFDQAFSPGSRLTQQEAVVIVRDQNSTGTQTP